MEHSFKEQRWDQIEREAELRHHGDAYIIDLIEADEMQYATVFVPANTPPEQRDEVLFRRVQEAIEAERRAFTSPSGVRKYRFNPRDEESAPRIDAVAAGWAELVTMGSSSSSNDDTDQETYVLQLTGHGKMIVDGYLKAVGRPSLDEQRQYNVEVRERMSEMVQAAVAERIA